MNEVAGLKRNDSSRTKQQSKTEQKKDRDKSFPAFWAFSTIEVQTLRCEECLEYVSLQRNLWLKIDSIYTANLITFLHDQDNVLSCTAFSWWMPAADKDKKL